jgi:hypothetical protein
MSAGAHCFLRLHRLWDHDRVFRLEILDERIAYARQRLVRLVKRHVPVKLDVNLRRKVLAERPEQDLFNLDIELVLYVVCYLLL